MKYSVFVYLIALAITNSVFSQAPAMTKGVNVQMANTTNAAPFPTADNQDAWVITVTLDGHLFFGVNPVTEESMVQEMRSTPRDRQAMLYIKADARAPYSAVKQAMHAAHENFFETAVLLTEQPEPVAPGQVLPPHGLQVRVGLPSAKATVVQLYNSGSTIPILKINDQEIPWSNLQNALERAQGRKLVVVEADGSLPFGPIARVIDISRSLGAKVAVSLTSL